MRIVVAADKFRGTLSAPEAVAAIAAPCRALGHTVSTFPLSDGGEGWLDVFGGPNRTTEVTGPLGDAVHAAWRYEAGRAVIEMAAASGLVLVGGAEGNDALAASTYGTGELIAAALESGAKRIIVGLGGSATTDGGLGALRAVFPSRLRGVTLEVACDVRTRFVDAASVFAPQKGASPAQVALLEKRLVRLVEVYRDEYGVDVGDLEGGGAAGGLAGGLAAMGGRLTSGFDLAVEELELDEVVADADLVITGEGLVDAASFDGKVVGGMVELAAENATPVLVVAGDIDRDSLTALLGLPPMISLVERSGLDPALHDTRSVIAGAVTEWLGRFP